MMCRPAVLLASVALLIAGSASAGSDPRIKLLPYDSEKVFELGVSPGYAAVIEFLPNETVDSVVVGNSTAWQISQTGRGDRLVVKPEAGALTTNMVVMTDQRRYVFLLDPTAMNGQSSFVLRFGYPQSATAISAPTSPRTVVTFKFHGDKALFPVSMRDDGKRTIISWSKLTRLPAVFTAETDHDALVNGRMVGDDYVIEGTASRYKFKYGNAEAIADRRAVKLSR